MSNWNSMDPPDIHGLFSEDHGPMCETKKQGFQAAPEDYLAGRTFNEQQRIMAADRIGVPFHCTLRILNVYLASNEWGNTLMTRVATDLINHEMSHEGRMPLMVVVHEHAGWALTFAHIHNEVRCVGSANDAAVYSDVVEAFRTWAYGAKREYLPEIRRDAIPTEARAAAEPDVARNM